MLLEVSYQLCGDRQPRRVRDHLLPAAGFERQDLKLFLVAIDQPAEQEAASRAGHEHVAVERSGISFRLEGVALDFVT